MDLIAESLGFSPVLLPADIPFDAAVYEQVLKGYPELQEIVTLRLHRKISAPEARRRAKLLHANIAKRYVDAIQRRSSR
ncbi:MAG: hypothetical protein HY460_00685 [Parcubacteria group bacterium]|nr:hypothetical protein [Parcubacteria group bacterium]